MASVRHQLSRVDSSTSERAVKAILDGKGELTALAQGGEAHVIVASISPNAGRSLSFLACQEGS